MGNKATKVSDEAHKAADTVRKRLTIRRRRPENVSEFSAEDIRKKFESIPKLTAEEKSVLQASWANVNKKIEIVRNSILFLTHKGKIMLVYLKTKNICP